MPEAKQITPIDPLDTHSMEGLWSVYPWANMRQRMALLSSPTAMVARPRQWAEKQRRDAVTCTPASQWCETHDIITHYNQ